MDHYRVPIIADCEELLGRFQASESVRYEQFLAVWKDMDFSSIFHSKPEPKERRDFARMVLSVVSPYLFPPYTFQIKVGGLYLLYGLFNTQLCTPKEKIRVALKDWQDVMQFQQDAVNALHYDVVYILRKLLSEKAFHFTAMPTVLFCRMRREDGRGRKLCEEFVDPPSRPQDFATTDMLEELSNVHEHYENLKKDVFTEPDPNLNLVQQNLVPKLSCALLTHSNWQKNHADFEKQDAGEGPSNEESSHRAQLLASIKSKSYGQVMEASKSRRHRQALLVPAADADLACKTSPKNKKTPSLKMRTQILLNIQGNKSEGLTKATRLWCLSAVKEESATGKKKRKFNWNAEERE
ncbi:snRNA-activating protein complex subunit 1-like isoform X3 [Xyrauchen texanus]|uniref:snRNA-activating protein complex subunit 1-like isoform X3 n=1 Tax=Xyrauchen texanus TaxID=154827 RepID=UPI00224189F2|nr:snRNA-activating protein complex subunit 1-like isoform X3 [Xyrauchen texanus]XP_051946548.1 snRNA-activating protein complex subunit 1-like isoform X3 [Xyrauchen texanus]XP_051946549.1 snRNA-activating protein complex subunit 1-like isoform X3 [Xyrauchen texanus]